MAIFSVEINCFICTSLAFKGIIAIDLCRNSSLIDAIDLMLKTQLALCFFFNSYPFDFCKLNTLYCL